MYIAKTSSEPYVIQWQLLMCYVEVSCFYIAGLVYAWCSV